ncbi:MAG: SLC13 family permease [Anaeroplasma sp.]
MLLCILFFPVLKIKEFRLDTFYIPPLIIALLFLILPLFNKDDLFNTLFTNSNLNPFHILVLFICLSLLSISLDESGFFDFIASKILSKLNGSQLKLFISLYILISILTIFTSNDIVILTFTPFILYLSKKGNINSIPYLVMEFVAANTYSMLLIIGNPTNIYLSSIFTIPFIDYFVKMITPTIICGLFSLFSLYLLFRRDLKKKINNFNIEITKLNNKFLCIVSIIHLISTTILLAISSYINLQMWLICLVFAISLLVILLIFSLKTKSFIHIKKVTRRLPLSLIPFILSMFVIIMALDSCGLFHNINNLFSMINNENLKEISFILSSTISANLINNIPMTLAFGSILNGTNNINCIYATIIGSNIGAILTPIGSLAGIMWLRILKDNNIKYSFIDFVKNGIVIELFLIMSSVISLFLL